MKPFTATSGNIATPVVRTVGDRSHILTVWENAPSDPDMREFDKWVECHGNRIIRSKRQSKVAAIIEGNNFLARLDN